MTNNRYKIGVCLLATLTVIICVFLFLHNKQTSQLDTWKQVEQSTDTTKVLGLSQQKEGEETVGQESIATSIATSIAVGIDNSSDESSKETIEEMTKDVTKEEITSSEGQLNGSENPIRESMAENTVAEEVNAEQVKSYPAGTVVSRQQIDGVWETYFQIYEIKQGDEVYQRINGKSYRDNPHITLEELRYIKVLHYNFNHQIQVGEIIVNRSIANEIQSIFKQLFQAEYEIESMYLVDNYWTGDSNSTDIASMSANNTSAFHYREITSGGSLSNHAYGMAIDINPKINPYIHTANGSTICLPANGSIYSEREQNNPHFIKEGDTCYSIFISHGFTWGGSWTNPIDYQHFEGR